MIEKEEVLEAYKHTGLQVTQNMFLDDEGETCKVCGMLAMLRACLDEGTNNELADILESDYDMNDYEAFREFTGRTESNDYYKQFIGGFDGETEHPYSNYGEQEGFEHGRKAFEYVSKHLK